MAFRKESTYDFFKWFSCCENATQRNALNQDLATWDRVSSRYGASDAWFFHLFKHQEFGPPNSSWDYNRKGGFKFLSCGVSCTWDEPRVLLSATLGQTYNSQCVLAVSRRENGGGCCNPSSTHCAALVRIRALYASFLEKNMLEIPFTEQGLV